MGRQCQKKSAAFCRIPSNISAQQDNSETHGNGLSLRPSLLSITYRNGSSTDLSRSETVWDELEMALCGDNDTLEGDGSVFWSFPEREQADGSGGLSSVEYFNMEHFVASVRREYVELNQGRTPPTVSQDQLLTTLVRRALIAMDRNMVQPLWRLYRNSRGNSIDFDDFVAVVTRLQVLKDRFESRLLNLPCEDCKVASFSYLQFINAAIL